jgi:tetratricopeptide (TPR) repeat protein
VVGRPDKAKEYIDRGLKHNGESIENLCLRGWIELTAEPKKALMYFEKSLSTNKEFFDAMLGMAKCKELINQFSQALECVNRILVKHPNLACIVVEKMKLQLCSQDWDQCNEVSLRALSIDSQCLEAFRYQILELLCRDGRYNDAAEAIANLYEKMEVNEPNSHALFYDYSKVFARVVRF